MVNRLEGLSLPRNSKGVDRPDMTLADEWANKFAI